MRELRAHEPAEGDTGFGSLDGEIAVYQGRDTDLEHPAVLPGGERRGRLFPVRLHVGDRTTYHLDNAIERFSRDASSQLKLGSSAHSPTNS